MSADVSADQNKDISSHVLCVKWRKASTVLAECLAGF